MTREPIEEEKPVLSNSGSNHSYSDRVLAAFNSFNGRNDEVLEMFYAPDVVFEDPVTRVEGLENLKRYYRHAYQNVSDIHFIFGDMLNKGHIVFAPWVMKLKVRGLNGGETFDVAGISHFAFDIHGKVIYHRDYLDLGAMIYERLPIFGKLISGFKRRLKGQP